MDSLLSQNKNQQHQCPPANDDAERPKTEVCRLLLARVRMLTQLQQQDFSLQCLQPVRRGGNASPRVQLRPTAEGSVVASSQSASHWRGVPHDCAVHGFCSLLALACGCWSLGSNFVPRGETSHWQTFGASSLSLHAVANSSRQGHCAGRRRQLTSRKIPPFGAERQSAAVARTV